MRKFELELLDNTAHLDTSKHKCIRCEFTYKHKIIS